MREGTFVTHLKNIQERGDALLEKTNTAVLNQQVMVNAMRRALGRPRLQICGLTILGPVMSEEQLKAEAELVLAEMKARHEARKQEAKP